VRDAVPPGPAWLAHRLLIRRLPMIRLAIAEEHAVVRWALSEALGHQADLEIVGTAGSIREVLSLLHDKSPDVLLLDANLDGLPEIRQLENGPLVIVLGAESAPHAAARAIAGGAHGYIARSEPPDTLLAALRAVSRGERVVPPAAEVLLAAGDFEPAAALTHREQQTMELLARGMTNREIAEHLQISTKTVDTHRAHLLKKLGLRNNAELTRFAVKHGYVTV
jgi:DNA-binding NarL/FixJ family response regulator